MAAFEQLDVLDVEDVFRRVAKHYGAQPLTVDSKKKLDSLRQAAGTVDQFSSLALTTTESLGYVYENTLISKQTRSSLGTHSTPSFLVDYVVGNLTEWVSEIPLSERSVFEPACGHGAFLVSAMRLLTEMLPPEKAVPSRRGPYLRSRLHGSDIDPFALELARLSLTLTDIPNPDGWDLRLEDMFVNRGVTEQASKNTIFLANPPFGNFTPEQQQLHRDNKIEIRFVNKASEMLWRTLPHLSLGSVFGVVLPQTFLHSESGRPIRQILLRDYELKEICLFPDKVFPFSDAESSVIIGRRTTAAARNTVRYVRVREHELRSFRTEFKSPNTRTLSQASLERESSCSLRMPDLQELWDALAANQKLSAVAAVGQGLTYLSEELQGEHLTYSSERFSQAVRGFVSFDRRLQVHEQPKTYWMSLAPELISRPRSGTEIGRPQVLLNYAPVSRGPWRLKAFIDRVGRPIASRFLAVRPTSDAYDLETLWALLNSPLANAYAFTHLSKRDNTAGEIRKLPVPEGASLGRVRTAVTAYLSAASSGTESEALRILLLRVDAEVLRLYGLPLDLESKLLTLFNGWDRVGVPFRQCRFLPKPLEARMKLSDFIGFENDWVRTNRERGELIHKRVYDVLTAAEKQRLEALQAYADYHIEQVAPRPTEELEQLEATLLTHKAAKGGKDE